MMHEVVLTFESVDEMLNNSVTTEMKATEQYFFVLLFIMICKVHVVLATETLYECDLSIENYLPVP